MKPQIKKPVCKRCDHNEIIYLRTGFTIDQYGKPGGYMYQYECCYCGLKWWVDSSNNTDRKQYDD